MSPHMPADHEKHRPRHPLEKRLLGGIDRTANAISSKVERAYERFDDLDERVRSIADLFESHPARTVAVSFFAGLLVGAWLARGD